MSAWLLVAIPVVVIGVVLIFRLTRWSLRVMAYVGLGILAVMAAVLAGAGFFMDRAFDDREGPERLYSLSGPAERINEPLAWRCALRTLEAEPVYRGYDWKPIPINRALTPRDIQPYSYLWLANTSGLAGIFTVTNPLGTRAYVKVELDGQILRVRRVVKQ